MKSWKRCGNAVPTLSHSATPLQYSRVFVFDPRCLFIIVSVRFCYQKLLLIFQVLHLCWIRHERRMQLGDPDSCIHEILDCDIYSTLPICSPFDQCDRVWTLLENIEKPQFIAPSRSAKRSTLHKVCCTSKRKWLLRIYQNLFHVSS